MLVFSFVTTQCWNSLCVKSKRRHVRGHGKFDTSYHTTLYMYLIIKNFSSCKKWNQYCRPQFMLTPPGECNQAGIGQRVQWNVLL